MKKPLVISIIIKSKGGLVPLYLESILSQTAIDENTIFYIRTNDNCDDTADVLRDWYNKWKSKWKIYFDESSINPNLANMDLKDWNYERLKIMGKIRNESIQFAISENADYFTVDGDILIKPHTIETLRNLNLPVTSPMIHLLDPNPNYEYTNLHYALDENGYFQEHVDYHRIHNQEIVGIFKVPLVHCTYLIKNEYLNSVNYDDGSGRYEYVIFSDSLRRSGIDQYFDNREIYGRICEVSKNDMEKNYSQKNFVELVEYIKRSKRFYA